MRIVQTFNMRISLTMGSKQSGKERGGQPTDAIKTVLVLTGNKMCPPATSLHCRDNK